MWRTPPVPSSLFSLYSVAPAVVEYLLGSSNSLVQWLGGTMWPRTLRMGSSGDRYPAVQQGHRLPLLTP